MHQIKYIYKKITELSETLGWIAIETDTILNLDGRKLSAFLHE